ncbi:hypothetical protein [Streptomyces sp. NPDC059786]|uniref:hypothetical protein n=1 Tax=Streptomyces sp. NPDC059786 TaxID=3346946 RepID=UPI00365CFA63
MHTYDSSRRRPFQPIPSARPSQDSSGVSSATPIYDALYAEWVRSFRALPGDRQGEEELGFTAFGHRPYGTGSYHPHHSYSSYSAYSAGAHSARQAGAQHQHGHQHGHGHGNRAAGHDAQPGHTVSATAIWQPNARQRGNSAHHVPAALPPAPRREL